MKKILIFIVVFFSTFALPALAADYCTSWGCMSTIKTLYTSSDGVIYVGTPQNEMHSFCSPVSNVYFTLSPTAVNKEQIYASLLEAYTSQRKIKLRIVTGHPQCQLAYVVLDTGY